jgi:hypothetical protein
VLDPKEKAAVFRHAVDRFPALVPAGATGFDDLAFLDHQRARRWYGRPVQGSRLFSSTGTSGYPKPIAWTAEEDQWYVGEKWELFAPWLDGCRRALVSLAGGTQRKHGPPGDGGPGTGGAGCGALRDRDQCAVITAFAPEVLYCSPSILASLIAALERRGRRPTSVRRMVTNGEVLFGSVRARAQRFFGIDPAELMDTYGSTEVGTIAHSCRACGGFHLMGGLFPEAAPTGVGDPTGQSARWRGTAVLAVSSVKRTSFPVVRFITYDVVRGLRRRVCQGTQRFSFDRILGRCDDVINYGELFSTYDLGDLIGRRLPGARWLVFNPRNDLTIVIEGEEPDGFREALRHRFPLHSRLSDLGLLDPPTIWFVSDVDAFVERARIPTPRRGKAAGRVRRLVPEPSWFVKSAR